MGPVQVKTFNHVFGNFFSQRGGWCPPAARPACAGTRQWSEYYASKKQAFLREGRDPPNDKMGGGQVLLFKECRAQALRAYRPPRLVAQAATPTTRTARRKACIWHLLVGRVLAHPRVARCASTSAHRRPTLRQIGRIQQYNMMTSTRYPRQLHQRTWSHQQHQGA